MQLNLDHFYGCGCKNEAKLKVLSHQIKVVLRDKHSPVKMMINGKILHITV